MRINNNLMAYNAQNKLGVNNNSVSNSIRKLSSGLKISRAGDDAAGLAISEKMRGQINGLNMASKNSQDAISLIQTAEGALNETHAILQRMRELSVQSASDTNQNDVDRQALQSEFTALRDEIDAIGNETKFNGKALLTGSLQNDYQVSDADSTAFQADGALANAFMTAEFSGGGWEAGVDYNIEFTLGGSDYDATLTGGALTSSPLATSVVITDAFSNTDVGGSNGEITLDFGEGRVVTLGFDDAITADELDGDDVEFDIVAGGAQIQTGANYGETLTLEIADMRAAAIGTGSGSQVSNASISTRTGAEGAITILDDALNDVSTQRSKLGAYQNRLEHKIKNLDTSSENLQAAESRIRDLDMAAEMTEFTSSNILSQAATSMLAQANSLPQNVLKLLG